MRKKQLGDWRENGSEDRDATKTQLLPREVCGELDEYEREDQRLVEQRKRIAVFRNMDNIVGPTYYIMRVRNNHTCRSLHSFNERFVIPFLSLKVAWWS